jgi:PAS domain S-box-containing protein
MGPPPFDATQAALLDFWAIYDASYDLVQKVTLDLATAHPEFGPLVRAMSPEQSAEQNLRSRELMRRAIVEGEWEAYTADLRAQGALYSTIGVSFTGWYDIVRAFQRVIVPLLVDAFAKSPDRLASAITAMLELIDYAMANIASQYLESKQEARFQLLVDSIRDYGIFMLDAEGRVATWNAGAQAVKGYAASEIIGKHFSIFYPDEDRAEGKPARGLEVAATTGRYEEESWRVRKDGSRFWANVVITAAREAGGKLVGFAKVTRDLSERKRAEDALRRSKEAADLANRELEAFSYSVAHDLRAPLRGINGFSRALLEDWAKALDPEAKDYLQRIGAGAGRMGALIDALLGLSRVTRTDLRSETVDLSRLAESVAAQLQAAHPERRVDFVAEQGVSARGDAQLLRLLFENLLGNAWKFTASRDPATIAFRASASDDEIIYDVHDDGAGFDMAYSSKLFAPFQRLHSSTEFPGTGVGLATAQRIVLRHGGRIWADGAVGKGATFHFTLPHRTEGTT